MDVLLNTMIPRPPMNKSVHDALYSYLIIFKFIKFQLPLFDAIKSKGYLLKELLLLGKKLTITWPESLNL